MKFKKVNEKLDRKLINENIADDIKAQQEIVWNPDDEDTDLANPSKSDPVFKALDLALKRSLQNQYAGNGIPSNVIIWGPSGSGKTSKVMQWAVGYKNIPPQNYLGRRLNLVRVQGQDISDSNMKGIPARDAERTTKVIKLTSTEFDGLSKENSILLVDEINRCKASAADALLQLIDEKSITDYETDTHRRTFDTLLFTVATANYQDSDRGMDTTTHKLSTAMINRLGRNIQTKNDPEHWLIHFRQQLAYNMEGFAKRAEECNYSEPGLSEADVEQYKAETEGRYAIAKKIVNDGTIQFDDAETEAELTDLQIPTFNSRSFPALLYACDGSKKDFLSLWPEYCNPRLLAAVTMALKDYQDDPNLKANKALKYNSQSSLLNNRGQSAAENAALKLTRARKAKQNS